MKKMRKITILILLSLLLTIILLPKINASSATFYTRTINSKGQYVRTQDAYLPDKTSLEINLNKPQHMMFDDEGFLWIADTGNNRIIKFDTITEKTILTFTHEEFKSPKGLFINNDYLYVADTVAKVVFKFDLSFNLLNTYEKPTSISYGNNEFAPSKIVVDNRENIYIYSEGVNSGIIQLSNNGEFLGFFTTNKIRLSPVQQFYKLIFSKDQFDRISKRDPATFSNIFIDKESIIYTTTMSTMYNPIKKHNTQGGNIYQRTIAGDDARSIYVDSQGIVYAGMQSGTIFIYDQQGRFIFSFGSSAFESKTNEDVAGLFSKLSAVAIRDDGYIFALDDEKSFLQSFEPTEYAKKIYGAINLYDTRQYELAIEEWKEVLKLNQMSVIAHQQIAESYLQIEEYDLAAIHYELAGNREGYSQAVWEIRNVSIQKNLGIVIIIAISIYLLFVVLKTVDFKTGTIYYDQGVKKSRNGVISKNLNPVKEIFEIRFIQDMLLIFKVMKKPNDSFYDIKKNNKGNLIAGIILYFIIFLAFLNYSANKGFIFQLTAPEDLDLTALVLGFFSITILFVICNYLDTSINNGIGTIKDIFLMVVYSLGPLLIAFLSSTILSRVLVNNEAFFITLIMIVGISWSAIQILLGISEIHQYSFRQTIRSVIMTLLFIVIIIVIAIIIISMWEQLYLFIDSIIKEVIRNVKK